MDSSPASRDYGLVVAARLGHLPGNVPEACLAQDPGELRADQTFQHLPLPANRPLPVPEDEVVTPGEPVVESRRLADHLPPLDTKGGMRGNRTATASFKAANRF